MKRAARLGVLMIEFIFDHVTVPRDSRRKLRLRFLSRGLAEAGTGDAMSDGLLPMPAVCSTTPMPSSAISADAFLLAQVRGVSGFSH